jgi:hypothetical protein
MTHVTSPGDGKGIPGFSPVNYTDPTENYHGEETDSEDASERCRVNVDNVARLDSTTVVDITRVFRSDLVKLQASLKNVHTIRLLSDEFGYHTYRPPPIGRPNSTMVIFPSFMPQLPEDSFPDFKRTIPDNVSTLVQHLSSAVFGNFGCGRGAVLFDKPGASVKQEVWVFTHYELTFDERRLGRDDHHLEDLDHELYRLATDRLKSSSIEKLILVDDHERLFNLGDAFLVHSPEPEEEESDTSARRVVEDDIKDMLRVDNLDKLQIMTWNEYAETLTSEQKILQALPDGVSHCLLRCSR